MNEVSQFPWHTLSFLSCHYQWPVRPSGVAKCAKRWNRWSWPACGGLHPCWACGMQASWRCWAAGHRNQWKKFHGIIKCNRWFYVFALDDIVCQQDILDETWWPFVCPRMPQELIRKMETLWPRSKSYGANTQLQFRWIAGGDLGCLRFTGQTHVTSCCCVNVKRLDISASGGRITQFKWPFNLSWQIA